MLVLFGLIISHLIGSMIIDNLGIDLIAYDKNLML